MTATDANSGVAHPPAGIAHFEMYSRGRAGVHWRLLSANNRDSGQSASGFTDIDACRSGLDRLLGLLDELQPMYTLTTGQRWEWTLVLRDVPLARSSRSFDRRLRCGAAIEWFIRTAPLAAIRTTPRVAIARLPEVTGAIRQSFTPAPYQRYRANLAWPRSTGAGLDTRDWGGG
jgi:hypothetical protein